MAEKKDTQADEKKVLAEHVSYEAGRAPEEIGSSLQDALAGDKTTTAGAEVARTLLEKIRSLTGKPRPK